MKHIKQIELIFENCEVMDVTHSVGDFNIEGITTELHRVASNSISKINTANLINFQIYGDGEIKCQMFDNITPIERLLKYNDITSIDITYYDNTVESFYPKYDGEELNKNQTTRLYKGDVFVVISEDKSFDDIYATDILDELIESKDFCMDEHVSALNNLKEAGWIQLYKGNDYIQLFNKNINIIISEKNTNILFLNNQKCYIIYNKVFYDICSLIFELCFMKQSLSKEKLNEYEYINIDESSIFDNDKNGEVSILFNFRLNNEIVKSKLVFNRDTEKIYDIKLFEGYVSLDNNKLDINDIHNLMWILQEYLPDEFWR